MPQVIVSKKTNKVYATKSRNVIVLKRTIPTIYAYDTRYKKSEFPPIDAGTYLNEGPSVDAGLYNTTSWEIVWDGGTP